MILVDALYINDGGGKVLLDFLIKELEKTDMNMFYLLDQRVINNHVPIKKSNTIIFRSPSLLSRYEFYRKNQKKFKKVLCFGNLPPGIKLKASVYTYFHNRLFLEVPNNIPLKAKLTLYLKVFILKRFKRNTEQYWVQSSIIKDKLESEYNLIANKIKVLPFFPPLEKDNRTIREKNTFIYVSSGAKHKNHERLIKAFSDFYNKRKIGKLILTVGSQFTEVQNIIKEAQGKQIPVINVGNIPRKALSQYYAQAEFLIFPSLSESFGLGLIEAIDQGCKVLAADLPYTYEVCKPSFSFNPLKTQKIEEAFNTASNQSLELSEPRIKNNIKEIISRLSSNI